jgi:biotin operon repressor
MAGRNGVTEKVVEYLNGRSGQLVTVSEIEQALSLRRAQVFSAFQTMKEQGLHVERPGQSTVRLHPGRKPAAAKETCRRMFEEIGVSRDGRVVIQDEAGTLYAAVEL